MAGRKFNAQIEIHKVTSLGTTSPGMVALGAKAQGLYLKNEAASEKRLLTEDDFEAMAQNNGVLVNQSSHGLSVGNAIRHDGAKYVKAQADNDVNAQVCGIVSSVVDTNSFRFVSEGFIPGGWTPGAEYFLSTTVPGLLTTLPEPEVWQVGQVRLFCGFGTTEGLKVEIDVGDQINGFILPTARLVGFWDREFEFCLVPGMEQVFDVDLWAVYDYDIVEAILESDGTLNGVSIRINGVAVTGLENITVGSIAKSMASGGNSVIEGNRVTLSTPASYSGNPTVIKGKLKILRE